MDSLTLLMSVFVFLLGTVLGSFGSVVIHRLRTGEKGIFLGRSHCTSCKHTLGVFDLVPLLSYAFSLGKCRHCKTKISLLYPLLELVMGSMFLLTFLLLYSSYSVPGFVGLLGVVAAFVIISFYDILYYEIPDEISIPTILLLLGMSWFAVFPHSFVEGLLGALLILTFFGAQILVSKGRWMGLGDLRIAVMMGLLLGWKLSIVALLMTYFVGSAVSIVLLIKKAKGMNSEVPFGPFLTVGTFIALFWGVQLMNWYLNLSYIGI